MDCSAGAGPLPSLPHFVPISAVSSSVAGPLRVGRQRSGGRQPLPNEAAYRAGAANPEKALQPREAGNRNVCSFPFGTRDVAQEGKTETSGAM